MTPDQAETFDRFRSTAAHYLRALTPESQGMLDFGGLMPPGGGTTPAAGGAAGSGT